VLHTVQPGDHLAKIAQRYGWADARAILDHPQNAALKRRRRDPNILHPGDQVFVPQPRPKTVACATGKVHAFRVKRARKMLRIYVRDENHRLLRNTPFVLEIGDQRIERATDGDGLLEEPIAVDLESAILRVGDHAWRLHIGRLNPLHDAADGGVSGAQARLANLGFAPGPVDGTLGPRTRAALCAFQKDHGLERTGELDDATRAKLDTEHRS
jgi:putative peptidoglycan binding protein/LysM domain-containing protein